MGRIGQAAWNKGKKCPTISLGIKRGFSNGRIVWNKGKKRPPFSEEWREKMKRAAHKTHSKEHNRAVSNALKIKYRDGDFRNKPKGERNGSWRGGITPLQEMVRRSGRYKRWRKSVLERDRYSCVLCGGVDNLEADHIKPFAAFPKLAFDMSNGRTLCKPCHRKTDSFGWGMKHRYKIVTTPEILRWLLDDPDPLNLDAKF